MRVPFFWDTLYKPEIINATGVINLGISDHSLIYVQRKISVPAALNMQKTEYMIVCSRQRLSDIIYDPKIDLGGSTVKRVTKTTDLIVDWIEQRYSQNEAGNKHHCGNRK